MLARFAAPLTRAAAPRCHRWLSTTLPRRASKAPIPEFTPDLDPAAVEAIKRSPVYQKFAANPKSLEAVYKFTAVMQAQGLATDKPPSMLQLSRLLLKSEVREAVKDLVDVFQKLGIDLTDKNLFQELAELSKLTGAVKK